MPPIHRQNDYAHAAQPLQLLPIVKQSTRKGIDMGDNGRAGGREAGHGFKYGVDIADMRHGHQHEWQRAHQHEGQPG